jgi:hypothetical protein
MLMLTKHELLPGFFVIDEISPVLTRRLSMRILNIAPEAVVLQNVLDWNNEHLRYSSKRLHTTGPHAPTALECESLERDCIRFGKNIQSLNAQLNS